MKNVETADKIHLGRLIDSLAKGQYVIPDFQRDFEWKPWDVRELIRSIFMDYYIGTLLLWKGSKENLETLSCEPIYAYEGKQDPQHIVLDGQQRLTAMHYAFFAPSKPFPKRTKTVVYLINIVELVNQNFEEIISYEFMTRKTKAMLQDKQLLFETHTFPLGEMKNGSWGTSDWIKEYRDYWIDKLEGEEDENKIAQYQKFVDGANSFKNILKELLDEFNISYIELDRDIDVAKVCDIFTQINSRGIRLDIFDLLNAILRPKDIYLKEMWRAAEPKLEFLKETNKVKTYILQVMSIIEQSYCSSKYLYYLVPGSKKTIRNPDGTNKDIILIEDSSEFMGKWEQAVNSIQNAIEQLRNPRDYGAIKFSFIPYPSIIPAFSAINQYINDSKPENRIAANSKFKRWYWTSVYTNRYSSSVESTAAKDYMSIIKWIDDDKKEPEMIADFEDDFKKLDFKNDNFKGSAVYNAIFNMFIIRGAKDWDKFQFPEYGKLDDHHIVPHSVFKDKVGKKINSILNRTPLLSETNKHVINNRMPNEYIKEMINKNGRTEVLEVMKSHLISEQAVDILLRNPFTEEDFSQFLDVRQKEIVKAVSNNILNKPFEERELKDSEYYEEIGKIEIKLREVIVDAIDNTLESYKELTPSNVQEYIEEHINRILRQKPYSKYSDFDSFSSRLSEMTLHQIESIITRKTNSEYFKDTLGDRNKLQQKFAQLRPFRNDIGHYKEGDEVQKLEGRAAIKWFLRILNIE